MKNFRIALILAAFLALYHSSFSQAHDRLVEITKDQAAVISNILGLDAEASGKLTSIYVREALATVELIVNAEPEVEVIREIENVRKQRYDEVKDLLDDAEFDLYKHYLESEQNRTESSFDSLQHFMQDAEFVGRTLEYYDANVAPYVIYYHQTYFKPALKQKHEWKINEVRQLLYDFEYQSKLAKEDPASTESMVEAYLLLTEGLTQLKRIRKRYRDELDYINVAMGMQEANWTKDYITIVRESFPDEVYEDILQYQYSMNAYGMDYILGTFSMILFDVWNPRSYVQSRNALSRAIVPALN